MLGRSREAGRPDLEIGWHPQFFAAPGCDATTIEAPEQYGAGPNLMPLIRNLLIKAGLFERRKDGRFHPHGLYAHYRSGADEKRLKIRDLSVTGGYLLTRERLQPGQSIVLTLESRSFFEISPHSRVTLRARTVRIGEDGVGATFVPGHLDNAAWTVAVDKAAAMTGGDDVVALFRRAVALALLLHICPGAENEILQLLANALNPAGAERVVEIVLNAEELIDASGIIPKSNVSAGLVLRLLQEASNADEELLQQCWTGLLAAAAAGRSDENVILEFTTSLLHLHTPQLQILIAACNRALEAGWIDGRHFDQTLTSTAQEIRKMTHAKNWVPIGGDLNRLYVLGFLEKSDKPHGGMDIDRANITPTVKGMDFYTVCCAHTVAPQAAHSADIKSIA